MNVVSENRKRDLYLNDNKGNVYFVPKEWCDSWSYALGYSGGLDWDKNNPDHVDVANGPEIYCYAPVYNAPNSKINTMFVLVSELNKMKEVTKEEAKNIHPELFDYLDAVNNGEL